MQLPIICYYTSVNPMTEILYIIANESAFCLEIEEFHAKIKNYSTVYTSLIWPDLLHKNYQLKDDQCLHKKGLEQFTGMTGT